MWVLPASGQEETQSALEMELNRDPRVNRNATGGDELPPGDSFSNDLPAFCFEPDLAETKRTLAWVNSVCLLYVIIGFMGIKQPPPVISRRASQAEEAVPTVIEPIVQAAQAVSADATPEQPSERPTDEGPAAVAVTADSADVAFSVPTVGNLLVPLNMAVAPPSNPMAGASPLNAPRIEQISVTGVGGSRPAPPYPKESLQHREQGTVLLLIEVEDSGKITSVTVKESSGYPRLDQSTVDYVRRHWFFGPAGGKRLFESPIVYELR